MGLTLVGDIATLQTQFETIKEEVDKQFDKNDIKFRRNKLDNYS